MHHPDHPDAGEPHVGKHFKVLPPPDLVEYCVVGPEQEQNVHGLFKAAFKRPVLRDFFWHLEVAGRLERLDYLALFHVEVGEATCKRALARARRTGDDYPLRLAG